MGGPLHENRSVDYPKVLTLAQRTLFESLNQILTEDYLKGLCHDTAHV